MSREMKYLLISLIILLPACWGKGGGKTEVYEETVLPYRQPETDDRRDPQKNGPKMMHVIRRGGLDGLVFPSVTKLPATPEHPEPRELEWGKEYTLRISLTRNPTWGTSTRLVDALLKETDAAGGIFRLHSMSAPFFGADKRSFVDGKAFTCGAKACDALDRALAKPESFDLLMQFGTPSSGPLIVTGLAEPTPFPKNL